MLSSHSLASAFALVLTSSIASAQPGQQRGGEAPNDVQILNYALTLEHLESAFYAEGLSKFDEKTFTAAGLNRTLFQQIANHESDHVTLLSTALGDQATKACNYTFPYTDIKGFAALSMVLEGVGVSAYLGAASYLTNKDHLTTAGSILATEARHSAYISTVATNYQAPWSTSFDTPLDLNQVYSLAAPFITSCPPNNPPLPLKKFPALNVTTTHYTAGSNLSIAVAENATATANNDTQLYVAFLTGLRAFYAPYDAKANSVVIPANLTEMGTVYAVLTSSGSSNATGVPTDDTTMAGPAVLVFSNNGTEGAVNGSSIAKAKGTSSRASERWGSVALGGTAFVALAVAGVLSAVL